MNWYLDVLKKYTDFNGRARRKEYWYYSLFNFIIIVVLGIIDGVTGNFDPEIGIGILGGIYILATLIPGIAVSVRRLHDTGRTGWWLFLGIIPLIGPVVLIVFMLLDSNLEQNQFGSNTKAAMA